MEAMKLFSYADATRFEKASASGREQLLREAKGITSQKIIFLSLIKG